MAQKKRRKLWKTLGVTFGLLGIFLLLFVVAFVFNPLEGSLPEVRDAVPRGVDFYLRKTDLAGDFAAFPEPVFWDAFDDSRGWKELENETLVQGLRRDGVDQALRAARDAARQVSEASGGFIDLVRDVIGEEVVVAGYMQDKSASPPTPLPRPRWCLFTRVTWRVKAAYGFARWPMVQSSASGQGVEIRSEGDLLVVKPANGDATYVKRHLDCLMLASDAAFLETVQAVLDNPRDNEPFGPTKDYEKGIKERLSRWVDRNGADRANAAEFFVVPNAFDGFRRTAGTWPDPQAKDSMNERVLASFLNLKGWNSLAGALLFGEERVSVTGRIVLNSHMHTAFQSSFFEEEKQQRRVWLDPFLSMVPDSCCAAAALRMPTGDFLHAMFQALEPAMREELNDAVRRSTYQGQPLEGIRELIDKLKVAFLPRAGFVFRKNVPDTSRDEQGNLLIPVTSLSPMPQVAWVFWLREDTQKLLDDLVTMLRHHSANYKFKRVFHLKVDESIAERVTEFTHPAIDATGEIAMIVFRDFFVVSNSGPLIKDILKTRYQFGQLRSIRQLEEFREFEHELVGEPNGFLWLHGPNLVPLLEDYRSQIESLAADPDPAWQARTRAEAEENVRRKQFSQYPSIASMPKAVRDGEFEDAVAKRLREMWAAARSNFTQSDLAGLKQMKAIAQMLRAAYLQVELQKNFIAFTGRAIATFR